MHHIDDSQPHMIVVHFDAPMTMQSAGELFGYLSDVLDKAQPFGFLMDSNVEGQHERGVAKLQKDWAKANKGRLGQHCAGIAIVTQSSRYIALYKPIAGVMIGRMYGCPGRLFTALDEAKGWLQSQLDAVPASAG